MPKAHCKTESTRLQAFLETCAKEVGEASGFVQRQSKLTSALFVQTLVLSCLDQPEASLNQMVQWSDELGLELTPQALDKRMTDQAVVFLAELVERAVTHLQRQVNVPCSVLRQFNGISVVDSTQVALPDSLRARFAGSGGDAACASVKFHLRFDYLAGHVSALEAVAGRSSDQTCQLHRQQLAAGSLQLFDLGYFQQTALSDIAAASAYFICRLHPQVGLYESPTAAKSIDMSTWVNALRGDQHEFNLWVGSQARVPVRILLQRLPTQVVEARRRKAHATDRRKRKTYSQAYLELLGWAILITNVSPTQLTFAQVMALYPIRWQIELVFKLWKSHARLTSVGRWRPQRVLCHLYARLLALILFHWLVAPWRFGDWGELSLTKAFQVLQRHTLRLAQAIVSGWRTLTTVLEKITGDFRRFAGKDKRRQSPSSFQAFVRLGA